jgi:hypothetical protein
MALGFMLTKLGFLHIDFAISYKILIIGIKKPRKSNEIRGLVYL